MSTGQPEMNEQAEAGCVGPTSLGVGGDTRRGFGPTVAEPVAAA